MALTLQSCQALIRHTRGRELSADIGPTMVINQAGEYLVQAHPWKWLVRPPVPLDLRGAISFTGATWVNGTLTLTKVGAFATYTWKAGDRLVVTAGTNTTLGTYNVASRVSNDAITLTTSLGATASAIAGSLSFPWIVLPSDFNECLRLQGATGSSGIEQTTYQDILDRRAVGLSSASQVYRGAIMWRAAFTDLTPAETGPVARMELDRTPISNSVGAFSLVYRAGWSTQLSDQAFALIPPWVEMLFVQILRAFARGYEEEDVGNMDERLLPIRTGPLFAGAVRRDSMVQRSYGETRLGELSQASGPGDTWEGDGWIGSPVAAPSSL